ncbi:MULTISPECIES: hypothetical protein [unclassified Mucilaginibacter]|uniref:hypothetical protein n=1 Tax=unclassified Mucilaginibacter TaxID=2617802 RepID=UPI002AC94E4B|nr:MULTISPECIES: hypothetical protein [unclassified Mucilaginibacter]MEB0260277.1 hypothetical protein [Mucilaginibacter sp. 10I4]MEB0302163.1 hypothetical protein [Mucilaginibacter sp. 5C4]WPX25438.1 hypothetical protein RHM67_09190 [Mucilaginibacter sp. 5C4]
MVLNIKQMEMGYSSLDLAMLLIAAFVIWAASRVPVKRTNEQKRLMRPRLKQKNQHQHSL